MNKQTPNKQTPNDQTADTALNPSNDRQHKRSPCPVACTLDILGDKWTLLVIRDLFLGKSTYSEFQGSPEKMPTNILAERLKRLERAEILVREQYQQRPARYAYKLTDKGRALGPILAAMGKWANRYVPGTWVVDASTSPPTVITDP